MLKSIELSNDRWVVHDLIKALPNVTSLQGQDKNILAVEVILSESKTNNAGFHC